MTDKQPADCRPAGLDAATSEEPFTLARPTRRDRHIKPKFASTENMKQRVLFPGANCLPGQLDLFE